MNSDMSENPTAVCVEKPCPPRNDVSAPFLDGAAHGVLMMPHCPVCRTWAAPAINRCPHCLGGMEWRPVSGRGNVFNWAVVHHVPHPGFADEVPYLIGTVELDEGPKMLTRLAGLQPKSARVGLRVRASFTKWPNGEWLPVFRPLE